jgi:hypothetical protein
MILFFSVPKCKMTSFIAGLHRYERDYVIEGLPYRGHDRHNGEIVAFHLSRFVGSNLVLTFVGKAFIQFDLTSKSIRSFEPKQPIGTFAAFLC